MKTKRIQLCMLGAMVFLASCGGAEEGGGDSNQEEDSSGTDTIQTNLLDQEPTPVEYDFKECAADNDDSTENHVLFEGANEGDSGTIYPILSVYLNDGQSVVSVTKESLPYGTSETQLVINVVVRTTGGGSGRRVAISPIELLETDYSNADYFVATVTIEGDNYHSAISVAQIIQPNEEIPEEGPEFENSRLIIPKSCHSLDLETDKIFADMPDEFDTTSGVGHAKVGFYVHNKNQVKFEKDQTKISDDGKTMTLFFVKDSKANKNSQNIFIYDLEISESNYQDIEHVVIDMNVNDKKKKVLKAQTDSHPFETGDE